MMDKFTRVATQLFLLAVAALWAVWSWDYYQAHPEMIQKDNRVALILLVCGILLIAGGLLSVTKDKNVLGIILAVVGTIVLTLTVVLRFNDTTLYVILILVSGFFIAFCEAAIAYFGDGPTDESSPATSTGTRQGSSTMDESSVR